MSKNISKLTKEEMAALLANESKVKSLSNLNKFKLQTRLSKLNMNMSALQASAPKAAPSTTVTQSLQNALVANKAAGFANAMRAAAPVGSNLKNIFGGRRSRKATKRKQRKVSTRRRK